DGASRTPACGGAETVTSFTDRCAVSRTPACAKEPVRPCTGSCEAARMVTFTLAIILVACSSSDSRPGSGSGDSQLPAGVLTPVDCTNLSPAPEKLVDDATVSDSVRLRADLAVGTGQVLLGWDDGSGAERWLLPAPTNETSMIFGAGHDDLPVWNIRIKIPCLPESA